MTEKMRAAVLVAPGKLEVASVPVPTPGPGEVRVRLEGSGICGSNLPPFEGRPWFRYPFPAGAPGHEGWGTIDELGPGVLGFSRGDRVACISSRAFADFDVVPASSTIRLAAALDGEAFPAEPLACCLNVFRRSDVHAGKDVAIVGIGFLGAVLVRLAANAGARVIAISRRPFALEVARGMGASETLVLEDRAALVERVSALTGGKLCSVVVEATGLQGPLDLASELVRERGRLVIAGYHQDGRRSVDMQLWNWRGLDVINAHERDPAVYVEGMLLAAQAVASGTAS